MQQKLALLQMKSKLTVFQAFWKDLWKSVDEWMAEGNQIVLGGDWNIDVRKSQFLKEFQSRNLVPAITGKHGTQGPETYRRGRYPIDEIFVSTTLQVKACGYLEHGQSAGDHRPLWKDVTKELVLGAKLPKVQSHQARKLKCQDPRIVQKYNEELEKYLRQEKFFTRAENLFQSFHNPLTKAEQQELEELDAIRSTGMLYAEKHCRKLKMGECKWSPKLQRAQDRITYYKLTISRRSGCKVGARVLVKFAKKLGENNKKCTDEELKKNLVIAWKEYTQVKKNHEKERDTYIGELAEALEANGKGKKASQIKKLMKLEKDRDMY